MPASSLPLAFSPVLMALLAGPASAQQVRGTVVAEGVAGERAPVEGARLELRDAVGEVLQEATSDSLGVFEFGGVPPGTLVLHVAHGGYLPFRTEPFALGDGESISLEVRLGREAIPLEPLVVTARVSASVGDFHRRRRGGGFGTYIDRDEVRARAASAATDLLRGVPGVRLHFVRWGVSPAIEMQGGFGPCQPGIFVDGLRMSGAAARNLNDYLTPERVEGVEVYASISTVPAQFQSGTCGVILFWTERGERGDGRPWSWWRTLIGAGTAIGLLLWLR